MEPLPQKKITVLGAGESGSQSALFLKRMGADVFLSELKDGPGFDSLKSELKREAVAFEFGSHNLKRILDSELVIISPGIPPHAPMYQELVKRKIPIWSEIELASRFAPCDIIAITGSAGKTTTTTLIEQVLRAGGFKAVSCGNIGNSFIRELSRLDQNSIAVVEVSSFQLLHTERFRPHAALLLNLSANHFDWHGSFEAYAEAKFRIFKNQTSGDYAILNREDPECVKRASGIPSQLVYFSGSDKFNPNQAAVLALSRLYHIDIEKVLAVFQDFKGIEHRLEEAAVMDGISYVNDSKSTTIASLKWALNRMTGGTVLIAGGRHKGGDFSVLKDLMRQKVKLLITIGEAGGELERVFSGTVTTVPAKSLEDALEKARQSSRAGDTVLFSPACASFDMFQNYEDRGRRFKQILQSWRKDFEQAVSR